MSNIKTARTNAGLSQKEIAITLGVSVPTVSDWESGKKFPSGKNLVRLSQVLHTTTDFLLGCEDAKKEPPAQGGEPDLNDIEFWDKALDGLPPEMLQQVISRATSKFLERGSKKG